MNVRGSRNLFSLEIVAGESDCVSSQKTPRGFPGAFFVDLTEESIHQNHRFHGIDVFVSRQIDPSS